MLDPHTLGLLIEQVPRRRFRKGSVIIQEGDSGTTMYVVISGAVRAFSATWDGREITYGIHGPGMLFGEMSLDGAPRSASVEAVETCVCAAIERDQMIRYLKEHPEFAVELMKLIIHRARAATEAARNMALMDVYGRVRLYLESAPHVLNGTQRVLIEKPTQIEIAQRVGASREMVSRIFKDLEKGGYLSVERRTLVLKKALPGHW